jgi:predicted nucleic acid-binding Zn ribbon protein
MTGRRRPMRRLGDLLPQAATALGLDAQLQQARAMASWERLVEELAPAAAGHSTVLEVRPGTLVVSADEPIVAQELRLRATELLSAFATAPGGMRLLELQVVMRRRGGPETGPSGRGWGRDGRVD